MHLSDFSNIPFVAAVAVAPPKLSMARIIEALIIAGITAMLTAYTVTIRLDERMQAQRLHYDFRFTEVDKKQEWIMDKITDHLMIQSNTKVPGSLP